MYVKLLFLWILVLVADYLLEFRWVVINKIMLNMNKIDSLIFLFLSRFEYLWPFWLLVRSIYDSFKYQGLVRASDNKDVPILIEYLFSGFFSVLHLYCPHQRHDLLSLHTSSLALLCGQHLCLGSVWLAYRSVTEPQSREIFHKTSMIL